MLGFPLLYVFLIIIAFCVAYWLIVCVIPMPPPVRTGLLICWGILLLLWVLSLAGVVQGPLRVGALSMGLPLLA